MLETIKMVVFRKDGYIAQELDQTRAVLVLRHLFERQLANLDVFPKLRTAVYSSSKARIGGKLWQKAFQTICNFSFSDADIFLGIFFCKNFRGAVARRNACGVASRAALRGRPWTSEMYV